MNDINTRQLFELCAPGFGQTTQEGDIRGWRLDILLDYSYPTEKEDFNKARLLFKGGRAYRWTRDSLCTEGMVKAYDAVVEIPDSQWAAEATRHLRKDSLESDDLTLHHYMVYFDGGGCYEVLAESVSIESCENRSPIPDRGRDEA